MNRLAIFAVLVVCLGIAAAPVCAQDVINGCVKSDGTTRILLPPNDVCKKGEVALSWNTQGPQGPAGPQGDPGELASWSQTLSGEARFALVLNDAAVLDRETGLVWEKEVLFTHRTWFEALGYCSGLTVGNRMGWRLPTLQELGTLVDPSTTPEPTLPSDHPFSGVQPGGYWSATTHVQSPDLALLMLFSVTPNHVTQSCKSSSSDTVQCIAYAWCVRGGHGLDAQ